MTNIEVKDFRGLGEPSQEEIEQIEAARASDEQARRQHLYRLDAATACPTAKLNTGHLIPLVGLGTW